MAETRFTTYYLLITCALRSIVGGVPAAPLTPPPPAAAPSRRRRLRPSARISLTYLLLSAAWIGWSDWLFSRLWPVDFPLISLYKGWGFVAVTSALLFAVLRREDARRYAVEQMLRDMAHHDALTGLPNRHCFEQHLDRALAQADRDTAEIAVMFIDLDNFKQVNDRFGHPVGDRLLVEVAARLRTATRAADTVARFGGDEFIVLVANGGNGAERVLARLGEIMAVPVDIDGIRLFVTASVGYAVYPRHARCGGDLLRAADQAMYRSKAGATAEFQPLN